MESLSALGAFLGGIGGTIVLLMPGYIFSHVFSRGIRGPELSDRVFVASAAIGGLATHVLMGWWTLPLLETAVNDLRSGVGLVRHYLPISLWVLAVLFAVPAVLGALAAWLTDIREGPWYRLMSWLGLSTDRRTSEAWNWIFGELSRRREGVWLKIHLRGGAATYLGAFGTNSLVSSDARVRDVYLERKWDLNEEGLPVRDPVPNRGVWIAGQDISAIEFYPDPGRQEA